MSDIDEMKAAGYIVRPDPDAPHQPEKQPPKAAPQFGEPWMCGDEDCYGCCDVRDSRGRCVISNHERDTNQTTSEQMERICETMNAMANIADPQAFVREVRELLERVSAASIGCGHDGCDHTICVLTRDVSALLARLDAGRGSR